MWCRAQVQEDLLFLSQQDIQFSTSFKIRRSLSFLLSGCGLPRCSELSDCAPFDLLFDWWAGSCRLHQTVNKSTVNLMCYTDSDPVH